MMEQYNEELEKNPKSRKVIYIFIGLFILTITAVSVFFLIQKSPVCGNDICEPFETPDKCCIDCECWGQGEVCKILRNKCEVKEIEISDERIKQLVLEYFENENKELESMEIGILITLDNKLGKNVVVHIKDQEWFVPVIVMENETVIEIEGF